jgi:hypothetical protein
MVHSVATTEEVMRPAFFLSRRFEIGNPMNANSSA